MAQSQLDLALTAQDGQKQVLLTLNNQLAQQLHDLVFILDNYYNLFM